MGTDTYVNPSGCALSCVNAIVCEFYWGSDPSHKGSKPGRKEEF